MSMFLITMLFVQGQRRYKEVYLRYFKTVYAVVTRFHPNQVEDVTQEVFERKIFKAIDNGYFQRNEDQTKLVITIAKHYCIDIYHKVRKHPYIECDEAQGIDAHESVYHSSLPIDLKLDLQSAFNALPSNQAQVMELTLEGYTDKEIAQMIDNPSVDAVRMLRYRARQGIKKFLRQ